MLPDRGLRLVIDRVACPVCRGALAVADSALICPEGHSFDVARQGYVSLFGPGPRANTGDNATMVAARERFLGRGHYRPIARAVSEAIDDRASGLCLELAGGTGYYLAVVLDDHADLVGLNIDLSVAALRRAARAHHRLAAVATDVWQQLPLHSASVTRVLSIFGPRGLPEIRRVLDPDGRLVLVTPTGRHLAELVQRLGLVTVDPHKQSRLDARLQGWTRESHRDVEYPVALTHSDVLDEVLMGPSAHHLDTDVLTANVAALADPITVTVSVTVSVFKPM